MLSLDDGKILVKLARNSIHSHFLQKNPDISEAKKFSLNQGAFVTLNKYGSLRGCIGYPEPVYPLYKAIVQAAVAAAFEDPRFPPVNQAELEDITVEVSALTVPEIIRADTPNEYLDKIKVGRDGLIVKAGFFSGLLLPIVAVEYNWTPGEFLEHTCQKAGLPKNAWKDASCKVFSFQSQVFAEKEPRGIIIQEM